MVQAVADFHDQAAKKKAYIYREFTDIVAMLIFLILTPL